jgi:hypothetical protein
MTSNIIDMIVIQNNIYSGRESYWVVLGEKPNFIYKEISPGFFQAEDKGVFDALRHERGSTGAFAGREFTIKTDRGPRLCNGDHWCVYPVADEPLISVGYATLEDLKKCYVFAGGYMRIDEVLKWAADNKVHESYYAIEKMLLTDTGN